MSDKVTYGVVLPDDYGNSLSGMLATRGIVSQKTVVREGHLASSEFGPLDFKWGEARACVLFGNSPSIEVRGGMVPSYSLERRI